MKPEPKEPMLLNSLSTNLSISMALALRKSELTTIDII
jgi:hypothetical protein